MKADFSQCMYLYKKGDASGAYMDFGAHFTEHEGKQYVRFSVYAPAAKNVYLSGDFNGWQTEQPMQNADDIWYEFVQGAQPGQRYKFLIEDQSGKTIYKADPYGFSSELRPKSDSIIADPFTYGWTDEDWMKKRAAANHDKSPMNIYEVQLSSWDSCVEDDKPIDLRKTGKALVEYAKAMHYTHIELMPVTEYPLDDSWGYQSTGYFALSGRYGSPEGLQYLINHAHEEGIGVILDWVPGHFCPDEHGLYAFDGSHLYGDRLHPHWGTYEFDFTKKHVWSFLISSACFWAQHYHIDGIRADGVTSMLYLNYGTDTVSKRNAYGGEDDLAAKDFLQHFNKTMHESFPGFLTFAEESSSYKGVTAPQYMGGLGFDYKWNMGWMNDTLDYFSLSAQERKSYHNKITFSSVYMRDEKFVLPLSHDEVVHGKKQMPDKMPGSDKQKFSALRALMAYQLFHPGKKLTFMGIEIAQRMEWRYYEPIEWFMLKYPIHDSFHEYIRMLNKLYTSEPALFEMDNDIYGFEWIDGGNAGQRVFSFIRRAKDSGELLFVMNASEQDYYDFRLGVSQQGEYKEVFSSNLQRYDGTGVHNEAIIHTETIGIHGRAQSICIKLPALSAAAFKIYKEVRHV